MKTTIIKTAMAAVAFAVIAAACTKESPAPQNNNNNNTTTDTYGAGVYIVNEGVYSSGTGTVSFLNRSTKAISNDIFQTVNNRPLGNVAQSMTIYNGKGYIVVNNAQKVEVVTVSDFKSVTTITGFTLPRYFKVFNSSKAYVSDMTGYIAVVDLSTNTITKKIQNGHSPETMIFSGNNLFVANFGGFGTDSTISVIDTQLDTVIATIQMPYMPNCLSIDANGKIWVCCKGKGYTGYPATTDTKGHLICIDPSTYNILKDISFPTTGDHPEHMVIDGTGQNLYYLCNNQVFQFPVSANTLNTTPVINRGFYSLGYDNSTSYIYAADAKDFSSDGWILRYQTTGAVVDSFKVGIIPSYFCFN